MPEPSLPDMGSFFGMAMEMQQQMAAAQESLHTAVVHGQAGGGVVRVEVTGAMEFRSIMIDPEVVDPGDVDMLQDLVLAALHDAVAQANALQQQAMGPLGNVDLASLDLGGLLGGSFLDVTELDDDEDEDDEGEDDEGEDDDEDDDEDDEEDGGGAAGAGGRA